MPARSVALNSSRNDPSGRADTPSPERLEELDAALQSMLESCPVPDHLRALIEGLEDGPPAPRPPKAK